MVNKEALATVVQVALERAGGHKRWTNAIKRGVEIIESNRCLQLSDDTLLILSASGKNYAATETECRTEDELCPAFANGQPCKHRAAYLLMQLYNEISH